MYIYIYIHIYIYIPNNPPTLCLPLQAELRLARVQQSAPGASEPRGVRAQLSKLDASLDETHAKVAAMMDRRDELTKQLARHYHRAPDKVPPPPSLRVRV